MRFTTYCVLAVCAVVPAAHEARAGDTVAAVQPAIPDPAMVLAMHSMDPAGDIAAGQPSMSGAVGSPRAQVAAPAHRGRAAGVKPAKVGEVLSIMLPAVVLIGIFLIPAF